MSYVNKVFAWDFDMLKRFYEKYIKGTATSDYNTLGKVEAKIEAETTAREGADTALGGRIDDVEDTLESKADAVDVEASLATKQDTITDLTTIRSGAALGATAKQPATTLAGYGISDAYTKAEVNNLVSTPHQQYVTVATKADLDAITTGSADTIYRVSNYDGTQVDATKYAEYAWNGTEYVLLSVKSAVDEVFDISAYNSNAKYANLTAALGTNGANVPTGVRKSGMSVKFIKNTPATYTVVKSTSDTQPTSGTALTTASTVESGTYNAGTLTDFATLPTTNAVVYYFEDSSTYTVWTITRAIAEKDEYVQYRFLGATTDGFTTVANWQGVDDEPTIGSRNFVESGGVAMTILKDLYETEDLLQYEKYTKSIANNGKWLEANTHLAIPLTGVDSVNLSTSIEGEGLIIAFLKSHNTSDVTVDFSSSYPRRITLEAGNDYSYGVPLDANYLYILASTTSVADCLQYYQVWLERSNKEPIQRTIRTSVIGIKEGIEKSASRGFVIRENTSVDASTGKLMSSNSVDAVLVPLDYKSDTVIVSGAVASRYHFYSSLDLDSLADNYLGNTTTGAVRGNPKFAIILFSKSSNVGGLDNLIIQQSYFNADVPRNIIIQKNRTISYTPSTDVHIAPSDNVDAVHVCIEDGVTKLIPDGGTASRYRFFNEYGNISIGSYIDANDTTSGAVPSGAKYAVILFPHENNNDIDNITIRKEYDYVSEVNHIEKAINGDSESLDLSNLPDFGYIITANNLYTRTGTITKGRVIEIPENCRIITIVGTENGNSVVAFLKDTTIPSDKKPNFADGYNGRVLITDNNEIKFKLNKTCKYLYFAKISAAGLDIAPSSAVVQYGIEFLPEKELNILFIGSSGDQDLISYLPPVLNDVLPEYKITYGDMYTSGSQADEYVTYYQNNTPCSRFNLWTPMASAWTTQTEVLLETVLEMKKWDIIMFKGSGSEVETVRQLMRIIQSLVSYTPTFITNTRISRNYDGTWEDIIDNEINPVMETCGFKDYFPIATAIENARSNNHLKVAGGVTLAEPAQFTVPAGKYYSFSHRIRAASATVPATTIKATRLSGSGEVVISVKDANNNIHSLLTLTDGVEHSANYGSEARKLVIQNNGSDECLVKIEDTNSNGNYLLYEDNQHTQSGLAILLDAYVIALKILELTGNSHRSIYGCSFVPTEANVRAINAGTASSNNLGHGVSCGVENYLGSDGQTYDRSQLIEISNTLYVATTVYNDTPDVNSVTATLDATNPINYNNIYAAQEIAVISVKHPEKLTDCSDVVISTPQKNQI